MTKDDVQQVVAAQRAFFERGQTLPVEARIAALKRLGEWARPETVKTPTLFFMADSEIHPEPYGVELIVSAWNYPFLQLFSPLAGALAAGNTALLKPAKDNPHSAAVARRIIAETFPPEHVLVLEGTSETTTRLLDEKFDTFTHFKSVMKATTLTMLDLPIKDPRYAGKLATVKKLERFRII